MLSNSNAILTSCQGCLHVPIIGFLSVSILETLCGPKDLVRLFVGPFVQLQQFDGVVPVFELAPFLVETSEKTKRFWGSLAKRRTHLLTLKLLQ